MKHKKMEHIIIELYTFYLKHNAKKIISEINDYENKITLEIKAEVILSEQEFQNLQNFFKSNHEYEYDEYWHLVGESNRCDELCLLASLIDYSNITYQENILTIYIERNK